MAGLWYRTGTVSVTNGSNKITGFGTTWKTGGNRPDKGHTFWGPDGKHYEVDSIESDTVLYLVKAYTGVTAAGQPYEIDITRTSTIPAVSREVAALLAYAQGQYDAWQSIITGSGGVTLTAPDGQTVTVPALANMLSKSGNLSGLTAPDTALGNLGLTTVGKAVAKAIDAAAGRSALGAQAEDATLTAIAGLTGAADRLPYFSGADTASLAVFTAFARSLLDDTDAATMRSTLGLVKQTSATDTTAGAVLGVGAFGLGAAGYGFSANLSEDRRYSHFSASTESAADIPGNSATDWGFSPLIHAFRAGGSDGSGQVGQLLFGIGSSTKGRVASRARNNGTWSSWKILHDNESLPYETGTFMPTLAGAVTAGACTYQTREGRYTRFGNICFYKIKLAWTGHTGSGQSRITGLPLAAADSANMSASVRTANLDVGNGIVANLFASTIALNKNVSGATSGDVNMVAAGELYLMGFYYI